MSNPADPQGPSPSHYVQTYRCLGCRGTTFDHGPGGPCGEWLGLSPQFAWALVAALEILGDQWVEIPEDIEVPAVARSRTADAEFCARMRASAHRLADELSAGHANDRLCECVADEVNLVMALERARGIVSDEGYLPVPSLLVDATVAGSEADYWYASEALRQDSDVEMLWDFELDGIEKDDKVLARLGIAYLHPDEWFEVFMHARPERRRR